jgi:lysophospholipase L1-like esterase
MRGGRLCRIFWILFAVVAGSIGLLEVLCRVVDLPGLSLDELDPISMEMRNARVEGHPYLAYANKPNFRSRPGAQHSISHNSLGFRGPETTWEKPPGTYRIVCLGGSSTYGHTESSNETTWPARLQLHLAAARPDARVEVINGGCQGYSTFESLINLELRMLEFHPDLVLVYHTINDMRCALYPGVEFDNRHWRAVWPVERKDELLRLLERSYSFQIWRRYFTDYVQERENLGAYVIRDFGRYNPDFYAQPDGAERGFANFRRNLVSIIELARAHGAFTALVTQAMDASDLDGASSKQLQLDGIDRMTGILRSVAQEREALLIDARTVLEAESARQREQEGVDRIFAHEVHLLDEGSDLLARTIAERLLAESVFP